MIKILGKKALSRVRLRRLKMKNGLNRKSQNVSITAGAENLSRLTTL